MRLLETELYRAELKTRMPFRYGIATMTALPHVFLTVSCEFAGRRQSGVAADHLPPKWFTKDPSKDPVAEIADMIGAIQQAQRHARAVESAPTVFAFWREMWDRQERWARAGSVPELLAQFGTSLVERAVVDAFCRARGQPFRSMLLSNEFGIDLGSIHAELAGTAPRDWLPGRPPHRVFARHTVGLADPLTEKEISRGERARDGLPQSLEDCIAAYGLRHFKLKVGGPDDLPRLVSIAGVLTRAAPPDYACSVDGNEAFGTVAGFKAFWDEACGAPELADLRRRLMFIEQPFHRGIALSDAIGVLAAEWPDRPPIIIDESDAGLGSVPRALVLGYAGTSHKNCKGVFKGIASACLIARRRRLLPDSRLLLTGEDLANIGPVALLQDLAVQAALGVPSVERNGHHYFVGLSCWPAVLQARMRERHPDLYTDSSLGWPTLRIENGQISVDSVLAAPFGVGFDFEPASVAQLVR